MDNEHHQRKQLRIKGYDYSQAGYYFVTICVQNGACILCRGEHCSPENNTKFELSDIGEVVDTAINNIEKYYPNIRIDNYVIMPNHIHMIIAIDGEESGRTMFAPTISRIIKQFKEYVTKQIGYSFWQKSYYDHVIRNEQSYKEIYEYIETNPLKWELDKYYK
ncbi:MAG TPA: transposase [Clostridia bacterium]|nr:transposase [Clostridia bacterium]